MNRAPEAAIETEDLTVHYKEKTAVTGVGLRMPARRITAIVGPSGCGKSSFLLSLNRLTDLIAGCRVSGRIWIDKVDVCDPETDVLALRRRVGMIFQNPNPFPLSVKKNLQFPLREHGVKDRDRLEALTERVLKDVGLWEEVRDRLDSPAQSLSGGQQQRLCIARALVLGPEILLMDEPCSSLDPISSAVVEDLITTLREKYTVVVVTHNLAQARRIADYIAVFWIQNGSGELIEHGTARQIFEAPQKELTASYIRGSRG